MPEETEKTVEQDPVVLDTRDEDNEATLIEEVRDRLKESSANEDEERRDGVEDLRFKKGGDYQWDAYVLHERKNDKRPIVSVNRISVFSDQVVGDGRQNKITIKIKPNNSGKKSLELAEKVEGRIRHIQEESDAQVAYETALQGGVDSGRGMISVAIIDCPTNPFYRELSVDRVANPYSHYLDPAWDGQCTESSLKQRKHHLVTKMIKRQEFERLYPDKVAMKLEQGIGDNDRQIRWATEDEVRIADYWVKRDDKKDLYLLDDGRVVEADEWDKIKDDLATKQEEVHRGPDGEIAAGMDLDTGDSVILNEVPEIIKKKTVKTHKILWYKVDGAQILDGPVEWPGRFIPHIPVWGKEINIEGKRDVRGIIRNGKDPQKIYNYERTADLERNALAKTPPVEMTPAMIKNHEAQWKSTANLKYQLYNPDPNQPSGPIHPPPPQVSAGNVNSYQIAAQEMNDVMGLQPPSLGKQSSAGSSGKKEMVLQQEGDVGSFEFHDNLVRSIRHTGRVMLDLFRHVYDTERELPIRKEDGSDEFVKFNQEVLDEDTGETVTINDLAEFSGTVIATAGPSYTTQRQETFGNLTELARFVPIVGEVGADMIVKNLDFVGSDELTKRLRRILIAGGSIEPNEEEQREIAKAQEEAAQNQENQQPDPEVQKAELEVQGKQLEVQKKEVDLKSAVVKLQEAVAELGQNREADMQGAADGAIQGFMQRMGMGGDGE